MVRINRDGSFTEIYNGPGTPVWERFEGEMRPSNGQFSIGLAALASLAETVDERHRLTRCTAT